MQKTRLISVSLVFLLLVSLFQIPGIQVSATTPLTYEAQERTSNAVVLYIGSPQAYVYNVAKPIDDTNKEVKPIIKNSRTLVPVRFISQSFGASVDWNPKTNTATIKQGNNTVKLSLGSSKLYVNNVEKTLDTPAESINDRTYIPLRALVEALNKKVFYDKGLIIINDKDNIIDKNTETGLLSEITSWFTGAQNSTVEVQTVINKPGNQKELTIKEIAAFDESVVAILTMDSNGEYVAQGSGFYIGNGLFITNNHVIADGTRFKIITNKNTEMDVAGVVKHDQVHDLAILKSKDLPDLQALRIGSKDMVVKGDRIVTIGSPEGLQNTVSDGIVSGFRNIDSTDYIQITAPITHGSSGGPLFDMKGNVIGVNTAGLDAGNLNFAVAIDNIKDWISELQAKSFNEIVAVDIAKQVEAAKEADKKEILDVISNVFKALNSEDIKTYKTYYVENSAMDAGIATIEWLFDTYNLEYKLEKTEVKSIGTYGAEVTAVYTARKISGPAFRDTRASGKYTFQKVNGSWKIVAASEKIEEYLDNPTGQTGATQTPSTGTTAPSTTGSSSTSGKIANSPVSMNYTDAIMNPSKPLLYITDKNHKRLYEYNIDTNKYEREISFDLMPESITFANNEIYVGLLKNEHSSYTFDEDQEGAVAIIDPSKFEVLEQLEINLDPFDIVVDKDGYIYVTSGSGQWTQMKSYSRKTKQEVDSTGIRQESYALLSPALNRIYTIDTDSSPRDMTAFNILRGKFVEPRYPGGYDSPYHGDYDMDKNFSISPDGKYIFNGAGTIFACGGTKSTDMSYYGKLNKSFLDIAFDEAGDRFFTSIEGKFIYVYDYKTFEGIDSYKLDGDATRLFYRNGKLVIISKDGDSYSIQTMNVK